MGCGALGGRRGRGGQKGEGSKSGGGRHRCWDRIVRFSMGAYGGFRTHSKAKAKSGMLLPFGGAVWKVRYCH